MESQYLVIPQNLYSLNLFIDAVPSETESLAPLNMILKNRSADVSHAARKRKQC